MKHQSFSASIKSWKLRLRL